MRFASASSSPAPTPPDSRCIPYTFRADPGQLPTYAGSFTELLEQHYFTAGVDGLFTDFPDLAVEFLRSR